MDCLKLCKTLACRNSDASELGILGEEIGKGVSIDGASKVCTPARSNQAFRKHHVLPMTGSSAWSLH